jgi:tRNA (guanine37-N1)-methyltransferase
MRIDVFTLIPEVMQPYLDTSILGRAREAGLLEVRLHNPRDYARDRHRTADDVPYGGGGGMVLKPEPIFAAVEAVLGTEVKSTPRILLSPQGRRLNHRMAAEFAHVPRLALLCGRYEGVDERVRAHLATYEVSIGDYVLTGGELPALVLIDSIVRWIPGALGSQTGAGNDSFSTGRLEGPHYTRPAEFRGWSVPEVLLSGDHARILRWRRRQGLWRTFRQRPDLLETAELAPEEQAWIAEWSRGGQGDASEEFLADEAG